MTCPYCGSSDMLHMLHRHETIGGETDLCYNVICQDCKNEWDPGDD